MAISSSGIGSNLDINGIISSLMTVEQRPITLLTQKEAKYQAQLTAYGSLKGVLASFQTSMQNLASAAKYQGLTAAVGDASVFTAAASNAAAAGGYTVSVSNIAQSQVLAAAGVASMTSASSTGTLTLKVGSGAAATVTIDASNNTLSGMRDAINAANAGVTATIVNDGSATPYKLVLTASASGAANTIEVTNGLTAGELYDAVAGLTQMRQAKDAVLTVNGVPVTSASNTLTAVIPGVTLNLLKAGDTTLTLARDTASVQAAVGAFVKSYNEVNTSITSMTAYNASTKQGAVLIGDSTVHKLQSSIRATLSNALAGTGSSLTTLSQIGVSFQKDGSLALDSAKLTKALENNFTDLAALFGVHGKSSNSLLSFVASGTAAKPGDYQVNITAAATQGAAIGVNALAGSTVIDASNAGFSMTVDGIASGALSLAHGTYTPAQLAAALQAALDSSSAFTANGIGATVTLDTGRIAIASKSYGTASAISGAAGTALSALGLDGSENGAGTDVAGSFAIDGTVIAATGSGQTLTAGADGITVRYSGTAAQAAANPYATLSFSQGYASRLSTLATSVLSSTGTLAGRTSGIDASVRDIGERRAELNRRLAGIEARYRAQFSALDVMVSRLNQTSAFLAQQLASLTASTK